LDRVTDKGVVGATENKGINGVFEWGKVFFGDEVCCLVMEKSLLDKGKKGEKNTPH